MRLTPLHHQTQCDRCRSHHASSMNFPGTTNVYGDTERLCQTCAGVSQEDAEDYRAVAQMLLQACHFCAAPMTASRWRVDGPPAPPPYGEQVHHDHAVGCPLWEPEDDE